MSSKSPIRFGAAICVYDDHQWLKLVLDSIYDGCDRIFALVGSRPWYGEAADNADTLAVFESYKDPEGKIEIIHGDWATEADQRNAGLEICEQNGCEICFVVDADEIYDPSELEQMMKIVRATPQIDCFTLGLHTYWKSQRYRIDPPEPLQPPVFVRVGRSRFTHNRAVEAKLSALIDPSVGVCHHMSYARTNEQIKKKISTFSHANEIVPGWYERVWLGWNLNRTMRNLHPTHPGAYSQAVEVAEASLPTVLRGCPFEFEATEQPWQPLSGSHACLAMDGSDLHGESAAWQRYLFFRPWYNGKRVVDLGCGEGFGTAYMATLAQSATGIETDRVTLSHALRRYEHASFLCEDLASTELKDVDLTVSFDVLDSLANVDSILSSIASSGCDWIGSTSRPDVAEAIGRAFCDREVRWLWQEATWPYSIVDDEPNASLCAIAVVGDREIPRWPSIGISIPTVNAGSDIVDAVVSIYGSYDWEDRSTRERAAFMSFLERVVVQRRQASRAETFRAASPRAQLHADAPPFLVVHGAKDFLIPASEAETFADELRAVSRSRVAYVEVPGATHGFDLIDGARTGPVVNAIGLFLNHVYGERLTRRDERAV